ncbi:MFS transporter [Blastococcus sp. CT_GayMR19]|uniref:MFS transporter n=1 Tax=Blastococcus sp. CT_GayMR19 TaxID=2559608 RepID=UPI001ADD7722|nr:MFS transporter [Blastococcus sp. CT_GayMR19]
MAVTEATGLPLTKENAETAGSPAPALMCRAALVWGVGMLGYILAVMQRTTFGVAGLDAADRFGISPAALSAFVFLQVAVYIAAQLPGGLLVDRYGARTVLVLGGLVLAAGQLLLAFAPALPLVVLARILVGAGDAVMFVAVLGLLPRWFAARRVPLVTQLTGILGQIGQILSAVPFLALLHASGWTTAFAAAAAASVLAAAVTLAVVRNGPRGTWTPSPSFTAREIGAQMLAVWRRPGTRLGFFGHMGTQFSMMVFSLLWGVPYLVSAQGLSSGQAGGLVTLFVVCAILIGPVIGVLTARHPLRRSWLVLGIIAANVTVWTAVLSLPGPAPRWLLVVLVIVLAAGGPGSVVGFDIARTSNPVPNLGVAQSIVNLGGFLASLLVLATMGVVLDALGGFGFEAFRIAWLVQYPVWLVAVIGIVVTRRKARRIDAARGVVPRPLRQVLGRSRSH